MWASYFDRKGDVMNTVEPIKDERKIKAMKAVLKDQSIRNYLLFTLGINIGLRITDLLKFKISDVIDEKGKIVDSMYIREGKSGKERIFVLNKTVKNAIQEYLDSLGDYDSDWYLFKSQIGDNKAISRVQAYKILNAAAQAVGIKEKVGTHSMRKTFGYWARIKGIATIEQLQELFNHPSPAVTKRYIGITQKELNEIYREMNL